MKSSTEQTEKRRALLISLVLTAALILALSLLYSFRYDLNDDLFMQHVLSGAYTGEPESRNNQSLFPLTWFLSRLYGLSSFDWYALFLLAAQFGSILLILYRVIRYGRRRVLGTVLAAGGAAGLLWYHLVFVQYSVTAGILCAGAAVWILTVRKAPETGKQMIKEVLPAVLLVYLAFLLRSEMLLFCSPFIALAALFKAVSMYGKRVRKGIRFLLVTALSMLLGMGIFYGIDQAAYSAPEWKSYREFFDARTRLYDFCMYAVPSYEEDPSFYEEIGVFEQQAVLIKNYNFGLDESIDADLFEKISDHAMERVNAESTKGQRIRWALSSYRQKLFSREDLPWNLEACMLFGISLIDAVFYGTAKVITEKNPEEKRKRKRCILLRAAQVLLTFCAGSVLYVYLLYNQRPVNRLTHCIYLLECVLYLWILFGEKRGEAGRTASATEWAAAVPLTAVFVLAVLLQAGAVSSELVRRQEPDAEYAALLSYSKEHPDTYVCVDVYSSVDFSEEMFDNRQVMAANWDLAGGWLARSPLWDKKIENFGEESLSSLLLSGKAVFAAEKDYDTSWISSWYASRGEDVTVIKTGEIGDTLYVYSLEKQQ